MTRIYTRPKSAFHLLITLACLLFLQAHLALADQVQVQAQISRGTIYVNSPFAFALEVSGASDEIEEPDLSALGDFQVSSRGSSQSSHTSTVYDQGGLRTVKHKAITYNYSLTPKKLGSQMIPAITVKVAGKEYRSQPIAITVAKPEESDDFKLLLELNKEKSYVGEPLTLTVTWLIGTEVQGFDFNLAFLQDQRLFLKPKPATGQDTVKMELAGQEIVALRDSKRHDGKAYATIQFSYVLIPKESGTLRLPDSSMTIRALSGYSRPNRRDPFSMFGPQKQFRTMVIPASELSLEVLPLPSQGRPKNFSGLVGKYQLASLAAPLEANVGDPLKLTVTVSGDFVDHVSQQHIDYGLSETEFKLASDAPEVASGSGIKSFTSTIRARHTKVNQIPAQRLSFFNPASGRYEQALSEPLPIQIKATRVITAQDAEGAPLADEQQREEKPLRRSQQGIRHNYEQIELASSQANGLPWQLPVFILPPLLYGLFYALGRARKKESQRPAVRRALKALARQADYEPAFIDYLAARLGQPAGAITGADVQRALEDRGEHPQLHQEVGQVFEQLDRSRYGGGKEQLLERQRLLELARQLEKVLK